MSNITSGMVREATRKAVAVALDSLWQNSDATWGSIVRAIEVASVREYPSNAKLRRVWYNGVISDLNIMESERRVVV